MRAIVVDKTGGPEVLRYTEDQAVPKLQDSEVLVKNKYGGINYIDTYFRTGLYPAPSWPLIIGQEAVGTVVSAGSSNKYNLKEGDEVVWMKQGPHHRPPTHAIATNNTQAPTLNTPPSLPIESSSSPKISRNKISSAATSWA